MWVQLGWARREVPAASTTNVIATVATTQQVVNNVVRGAGFGMDVGGRAGSLGNKVERTAVSSSEAVTFVFQPVFEPASARCFPI
jgi:hypothetical protein